MKKLLLFIGCILFASTALMAQDSIRIKTKRAAHHAHHAVKKGAHSVGKAIDTATSETGKFVKRTSKKVASAVVSSKDRSMLGPNGEKVYNGPRGGKYYISKDGNKVYLKKERQEAMKKN